MELKIGLKHRLEKIIEKNDLADAYRSGNLPVLATPCMIALMENTAMNTVADCLAEGQTTVGTAVDIQHIAPSKQGDTVVLTAELTEIEGRILTFDVQAFCNDKQVGYGSHKRAIIDSVRFMDKLLKS